MRPQRLPWGSPKTHGRRSHATEPDELLDTPGPSRRASISGVSAAAYLRAHDHEALAVRLPRGPDQADPDIARRRGSHVLLDGSCPGLVIDRRRTTSGQWQGLVVRVEESRLIIDWVSGDRITKP